MTNAVLQSPNAVATARKIQQIVLPGQTPAGEHILSVLVKRTYDIVPGGRCSRAAADRKLIPADVHYGDPMNSTVEFESDFVPFKLATDVVLLGKAYAPPGQRVFSLTASVKVGEHHKDLLVVGDRVARYNPGRDPSFTDPEPFESMELRYERAYGGVDIYSEPRLQCIYPRNHLGRGYAVVNAQRTVENLLLPNIEDPECPLTPATLCAGDFQHWERQPFPQGFGWTMKLWQPRAGYAGLMPADRALERELRKAYATLVPPAQRKLYEEAPSPTMDFRFFNGASPGLVLPFLSGVEDVELVNLHRDGRTQFRLPSECPAIHLDIGQGTAQPAVVLQTVTLRTDDEQVDLVWRGAIPYPGPDSLPEIKKMDLTIA